MPRGLNKVLLIGQVGRDPELRRTPSGRPVASFSLSVDRGSGSGSPDDRSEGGEWFTVVAWDDLAERCHAQLTEGLTVFVEGRLKARKWQNSEGRQRSATEVVASELVRLEERAQDPADDLVPAMSSEQGE